MARSEAKSITKKRSQAESMPFGKENYQILGVGVLLIVLGYVALAQSPWDGFMPLIVAPVLLIVGYCVVIPVGILYRKKAVIEAENVSPAEN